jgi:hypothetical protein
MPTNVYPQWLQNNRFCICNDIKSWLNQAYIYILYTYNNVPSFSTCIVKVFINQSQLWAWSASCILVLNCLNFWLVVFNPLFFYAGLYCVCRLISKFVIFSCWDKAEQKHRWYCNQNLKTSIVHAVYTFWRIGTHCSWQRKKMALACSIKRPGSCWTYV